MITRFYVDNYKCLVNFEYKPQPLELIIGANGSGKSTVFEALSALRDFVVERHSVEECFSASTLTRWQNSHSQVFELSFEADDPYQQGKKEELRYFVHVQYDEKTKKPHIVEESLQRFADGIGHMLYAFTDNGVWLYRDDSSLSASFPFNLLDSGLAILPALENTQRAEAFRRQLASLLIVHLNPMAMDYASEEETSSAKQNFSNFASWYRHFSQEQPQETSELREDLQEIINEFEYLQLSSTGSDRRELRMKSKGGKDAPFFRFDELSDGQRALIVLYSLLHFAIGQGATVCIDEPENFVALRELQPLALAVEDKVEESDGQVLLISHNQEFINMLTDRGKCIRFHREDNRHTRISVFSPEGGLEAAEIVARGWEDDE